VCKGNSRCDCFNKDVELSFKSRCQKREPKCHCHKEDTCENISGSVAEMEFALADLLKTEVEVLKNSAGQWSEKQVEAYTHHIEKTLKKIILKEIVLILLMEECNGKNKKCKCKCTCKEKCHCKDKYFHDADIL
jgi:hypothetical protein